MLFPPRNTIVFIAIWLLLLVYVLLLRNNIFSQNLQGVTDSIDVNQIDQEILADDIPLSIDNLKQKDYPGSDLQNKQSLSDGSNYRQYLAAYDSEGFKIYGLLTIRI